MNLNPNDAQTLISTISDTINSLVTNSGPREPLVADTGLVPREWTDIIAKQMGYSFIAWRQHGGPYPGTSTTRPLSPSEALTSYANRAETSDADYAAVRDNAPALVARIPNNVQYGSAIPTVLAQFAAGATG